MREALLAVALWSLSPCGAAAQDARGANAVAMPAQPVAATAPAAPAALFAFANASPLTVFDDAAMKVGRLETFEFGAAYQARVEAGGAVRVQLKNGRGVYASATNFTTTASPRWLATTPFYNRPERAGVQLWENPARLRTFLSGKDTVGSQSDYEERIGAGPQFQLRLPVTSSEQVALLGGARQVKMMSVLLPVRREMRQAFDAAKSALERQISLHFLVDVSGSTTDFLEPLMSGVVKGLSRSEALRNRMQTVAVTTFGGRVANAKFMGRIALQEMGKIVWHPASVEQPTAGEREPLVDGLIEMSAGLRGEAIDAPTLVILSGADVEMTTVGKQYRKAVAMSDLKLPMKGDAFALFAQITPEPGDDLREASRRLPNVKRKTYLDYSDSLSESLVQELSHLTDSHKSTTEVLRAVIEAAYAKQAMPFVPSILTPAARLPAPQPYATQSEWFVVALWLTLDELLWQETDK